MPKCFALFAACAALCAAPVRAGDFDSIDSITRAVYDVISGPAGARDWPRFRSLPRPAVHGAVHDAVPRNLFFQPREISGAGLPACASETRRNPVR